VFHKPDAVSTVKEFAVYSFGFVVAFSTALNDTLTMIITSTISVLLFSHLVISIAMPALKKSPTARRDCGATGSMGFA
jgi:hypothetical protein